MNKEELIEMLINKIVDLKQELDDTKNTMYRVSDYLLEHNIILTIHNDKTITSRLDNKVACVGDKENE